MMGIIRAFGSLISPRMGGVTDLHEGKASPKDPAEMCTILIIDDDSEFLQLMRAALKDEGYNVLSASSGPKGLDMLRYAPSPVRVVLLDFDMPKLNGAETLNFLRRLNPHSKVVAVTGMSPNFLPGDFRDGVDHTIYKPFQMADLVALIHRMVLTYPALTARAVV